MHAKYTNFILGTTHIHTHRATDTHKQMDVYRHTWTQIQIPFHILYFLAHWAYMPKIQILCLAHHRHTPAHAQIHVHICTESPKQTDIHRHMHLCLHTQTHIHRHTCTQTCMREI